MCTSYLSSCNNGDDDDENNDDDENKSTGGYEYNPKHAICGTASDHAISSSIRLGSNA